MRYLATPATCVIYIVLGGGPTHIETFDPKPDASAEYRGTLGVINTNVPGILVSELLVDPAKVADNVALLRSMHYDYGDHFPAVWTTAA